MDTPKSIYPIYGKKGDILEFRKGADLGTYPEGEEPPPYISVLFTGRCRILKFFRGNSPGSVNWPAVRAWVEAYDEWEKTSASSDMEPMWDRYYCVISPKTRQVRYLRDR